MLKIAAGEMPENVVDREYWIARAFVKAGTLPVTGRTRQVPSKRV